MTGRYNSFEDTQLDVKFVDLDRRVRSLEALAGVVQGAHSVIDRYTPAGTENFTGTLYNDITGLSVSFQKLSSDTLLKVTIEASGFVNTINTQVFVGVDADTYTDYDIGKFVFSTANVRQAFTYTRYIPDTIASSTIDAGVFTVQALVRVNANQFSINADDLLTLQVSEVAP